MAQTSVSIRMDEGLRKQFNAFCSDIDMNMSTASRMFTRTAVRERRIPFEISAERDPFYGTASMTRLKKSIAEMETTGGTVHEAELDG